MADPFLVELNKLAEHFDIPLPLGLIGGSANAKFRAAAEFLGKVNSKLGPPPKKAKKESKE